jgi:hypothetical protein
MDAKTLWKAARKRHGRCTVRCGALALTSSPVYCNTRVYVCMAGSALRVVRMWQTPHTVVNGPCGGMADFG